VEIASTGIVERPAGKYKVEVFLNDQSAGMKDFDVRAG